MEATDPIIEFARVNKWYGAFHALRDITLQVTSGERVKFPDGHEEDHKKVKTKDPNETRNLVRWILSLPGGTSY
jgi:hypothetical protein